MKKVFALLLVAILAVTCLCAALSVSAEETYTDQVSLLPDSADKVTQTEDSINNNGKLDISLKDGELKLTRADTHDNPWPSAVITVNKEVDLSKTPKLHLNFVLDPDGEDPDADVGRGVNGIINYTVNGEEKSITLIELAGRGTTDYRISSEAYLDFPETGKITVTTVSLSLYGQDGQSLTWKNLAFASEGAADESSEDSKAEETSSDKAPAESSAPAEATSSAPAETSSAPAATSSTAPATSSTSKPATGDEGIIVFAVLGLVAVAGTAIAVKARH